MGRYSRHIPDEPQKKGISHYVNGINRDAGMHDGIRKNCAICAMADLRYVGLVIESVWQGMPENDEEKWIWE